ncbi:hypothetical protein [Paenibacillus faecalis]|uniref:hypothetical protein n=1 Tax=Paenibacillus faecalis TaxID=2079532 RepID=UPI001F278EA6|nr:hypothetical protein [Paenibacillus faecalis]
MTKKKQLIVERVIVIKIRSFITMIGFIILILLLGGCQQINKNNITNSDNKDEKIIEQAKATAIKHLKAEYELEVEITGEKKLPDYIAQKVIFEGNVVGNKEQHFSITVNYTTNETSNFGMSPELVEMIKTEGYEPFDKEKTTNR